MPPWKDAADSPGRYQWDETSGTPWSSQSVNCGPTSVTKIADFYRDARFSIEQTRYLAVGCCIPTTCTQQASMLTSRGVSAIAMWVDTLGELDYLVGWDGKRPIVVGIEMSRVPTYVKDHPFDGWHAVVVLKRVVRDGIEGYLLNDPNFSPPGGYRPDPDHGKKFYPRWVMDYAFIQNGIRWGVVPNKAKYVEPPTHLAEGDPMDQEKLFINELGHRIVIRADKPIRAGFTTKDRVLRVTGHRVAKLLMGRLPISAVPDSEQKFGPVFMVYLRRKGNRGRIGYVKEVDIVEGSYK